MRCSHVHKDDPENAVCEDCYNKKMTNENEICECGHEKKLHNEFFLDEITRLPIWSRNSGCSCKKFKSQSPETKPQMKCPKCKKLMEYHPTTCVGFFGNTTTGAHFFCSSCNIEAFPSGGYRHGK